MPFQILSLSGGGFLGLYSAIVLAEIEAASGRPLADRFDLVAGTSVGGILAIAIAARVPMTDVVKVFKKFGPQVFSSPETTGGPWKKKLDLFRSAFAAKHDPEILRGVISSLVGGETRVEELRQRLLVPVVNLTKGGPQVFKTPHHRTLVRDRYLKLVDVGLAAAAAPSFFPIHSIGGELFADGGLFANSPDYLALHEAEHFLGYGIDHITMVSIGTTTSHFSFSNSKKKDAGWLDWLVDQRLPKVMIASQQQVADSMMRHRLGDRYIRIDRVQSPEQVRNLALDMATTSAISDLEALAEVSVREVINHPLLNVVLKHRAPKMRFL